ncbi:MAG: 50S ribosomal protein L24 [Candidatus Methylacidiphilales bacterium]|nr:50S ribosomal protein L24 [Candidatus Methylacidiphilales bacterium]
MKNQIAPQKSFHVKKNDLVVVISGAHRKQRGKILQVLRDKNRVVVEGINMIKKATRKSEANPQGGYVEREGTIHISNVMSVTEFDAREARRSAKSGK